MFNIKTKHKTHTHTSRCMRPAQLYMRVCVYVCACVCEQNNLKKY